MRINMKSRLVEEQDREKREDASVQTSESVTGNPETSYLEYKYKY